MDGPFFVASSSSFTSNGTGNAGNISLSSVQGNISMTDGPFITSQTLNSTGIAGNIIVNAPAGDVLLAGGQQFGQQFPGQLFTAIRPPTGQSPQAPGSGAVQITAKNLTLDTSNISGDNLSPLQPGNITVNLSGTLTVRGIFH